MRKRNTIIGIQSWFCRRENVIKGREGVCIRDEWINHYWWVPFENKVHEAELLGKWNCPCCYQCFNNIRWEGKKSLFWEWSDSITLPISNYHSQISLAQIWKNSPIKINFPKATWRQRPLELRLVGEVDRLKRGSTISSLKVIKGLRCLRDHLGYREIFWANSQLVYITPLRHGRMCKWLDLDSTRGAAVREGRVSVG